MSDILAAVNEFAATIYAAPQLAFAGVGATFIAAALSPSQQLKAHWIVAPSILLSPLALIVSAAEAWLMLAASVLFFGAVAEFGRARERYQHVAPAGLRLMAGASVTPALWAALPVLLAVSPALSPWRQNHNQIVGFLFVLWAPLVMFAAAISYLLWMFDFSVYQFHQISFADIKIRVPSIAAIVISAVPLTIVGMCAAVQPAARRAGFVGVISALGGIVSLGTVGAPIQAQLALSSGAAFAFAAASTRPGLLMTFAIFGSATSVYLLG